MKKYLFLKTHVAKSYAKINIALNVAGKREDGYHELDMIMVPLKLHDTLIFTALENREHDSITIDNFSIIAERNNLVSRAIEMFDKIVDIKQHFSVYIHKVTPIKGGFGGGSSNAAATLKLLNRIYKADFDDDALKLMALKLGSDVPFFIDNKPARCRGVGEKIEPIIIKNNYFVLTVKPKDGCSTKEVFSKCDEFTLKTCDMDLVISALENGDDELLAKSICNSLEEPASKIVPEILVIEETLRSLGLSIVGMTGSGSGVFAMSTNKSLLKKAYKALINKDYEIEFTKVLK